MFIDILKNVGKFDKIRFFKNLDIHKIVPDWIDSLKGEGVKSLVIYPLRSDTRFDYRFDYNRLCILIPEKIPCIRKENLLTINLLRTKDNYDKIKIDFRCGRKEEN